MSASKTCRRLSLLTGSSAFAAIVLATGGIVLTPTSALAANECGDPSANGATADTFVCTGSFPAISYPTTNGNLALQLQNNVTTTSGGLVVAGTGTNTVTISRIADSPANSGDPSLTSTSGAGVQVTNATGGTISVNLSDTSQDAEDDPLAVSGTIAGVRLQNAGTAATNFTSNNGTITASNGVGIDISTVGTGTVTLTNGSQVTGTTIGARLGSTGTGNVTVTNGSSSTTAAVATITGPTAAISVASGNNATVTNNVTGRLNGLLSFSNTGNTTITNNGEWAFAGTSALGAGTSVVTNNEGATLTAADSSILDFATGTDTFNNAGRLAVDGTLTLVGLEVWNNSSFVAFGADDAAGTHDRVVYAGTFNGSASSALLMDVSFAEDQVDCAAAVTADCLDLRGGTTSGATTITVNPVAIGAAERIVLVDVAGAGASAAGRFTLDGDTIDGGLFLYSLEYDAAAQQHALVASDLGSGGTELALFGRAASEPWRTATGMWHDRQADLRNALVGRAQGYAPGAWLKIAGSFVDDSRLDANEAGTQFDNSYAQETTAIVGGVDVIRIVGENSAWVLGLTAGQVDSIVDYITSPSVLELEGQSFGAYASVLAGPAFFDAIINATDLDLTHAALGQEFEGAAKSIGYQLEGGYRLFRINEDGAWFEPLAALSYVRTDVDDLELGQVTATFDEAASLRAAVGARVGGDLVMDALTASFSFTGRLWKELDGDNNANISGDLSDFDLSETGMDNLGDLGLAVSLFTLGNRLSAHLAYNLLFREDYQNTGASFGVRYNW